MICHVVEGVRQQEAGGGEMARCARVETRTHRDEGEKDERAKCKNVVLTLCILRNNSYSSYTAYVYGDYDSYHMYPLMQNSVYSYMYNRNHTYRQFRIT